MSDLVDSSPHRTPRQVWVQRAAVVLGLTGIVALVAWAGLNLSHSPSGPQRQVAKIALLPDTPPPPPPPPPDKPKIEPKNEMKQMKLDKQTPPEPQQLKMEGQAGEGPSPFTAGEVKSDYIGGDIGNGERFAAYVSHVAQIVQEAIARRNVRGANARVLLWLKPDGSVQRYEVRGASGDLERELRTAMANLGRVPEAPPGDMPMPMGLEISDR
jgi:periplasmic protein TonB